MADAADLKSVSRKGVWVRIPPWAPVYRVLTREMAKALQRGQLVGLPPFCPHLFENGLETTSSAGLLSVPTHE